MEHLYTSNLHLRDLPDEMAPISPQNPGISNTRYIIIGVVIGTVGIVILPLIATAIWILWIDIWRTTFKNRPRYRKQEKLRREWNKAAQVEQHRQQTAKCIIKDNVERKKKSVEMCSLLMELVSNHDLVLSFRKYII